MKIGDYIVIVFMLVFSISGLFISANRLTDKSGDTFLQVRINGKIEDTYKLDSKTVKDIEIKNKWGRNLIHIEGDTVYMKDSDCPDKICMHMHKIKNPGESIICLPNRLEIKIVGNAQDSLDVILK